MLSFTQKKAGYLLEEKILKLLFELVNLIYKVSLIKIIINQSQYSDKDVFKKINNQQTKL